MEERNIALYIIATILTCGIFGLYWMYCLNEDSLQLSEEEGVSGGLVIVLAFITCGLYTIYWAYKMGERVDIISRKAGLGNPNAGILYLVLAIFGFNIISMALMQSELNRYRLSYRRN